MNQVSHWLDSPMIRDRVDVRRPGYSVLDYLERPPAQPYRPQVYGPERPPHWTGHVALASQVIAAGHHNLLYQALRQRGLPVIFAFVGYSEQLEKAVELLNCMEEELIQQLLD